MRITLICGLLLSTCWGCISQVDTTSSRKIQGRWAPAHSSHVQIQIQSLGEIPNNRLQLPVASPDGQWVAYLQLQAVQQVDPNALFTGKGLETMSLHIRNIQSDAPTSLVCPSGAIWPAWSADNKKLYFVAYSKTGRCDLGIYDVSKGTVKRISTGLDGMMMPAVSPSGKRVAVIGKDLKTNKQRLYVVTPENSKTQLCPIGRPGDRHFWPQWTADGRIIFVLAEQSATWLARWSPGKFPPEKLYKLSIPSSNIHTYQSLANISQPLSPTAHSFAYYEAATDRIVLINLADGKRVALPPKTRAGCWLDSKRFVAAKDKELLLLPQSAESGRLARGRWLPIGSVKESNEIILCTQGSHQRLFALVRMKVLQAK